MQNESQIQVIAQKITTLLEGHPSHFLVDIKIKPTNNIKVFLDADEGINLSTLIQYNRRLYKDMEESGLYPDGNFSLEVSSPDLNEPLKKFRQYKKNIGRYVEVLLNDSSKKEGKLVAATEDGIVIAFETGKGKTRQTQEEAILFDNIKSTKIQVKF
jgi:ribosome maturation factor RimP